MFNAKRALCMLLAAALVVPVAACSSASTPPLGAVPPTQTGSAVSHGGYEEPGSILDDTSTPSMSVATAESKAATGLLVPDSSSLGAATRATLTNAEGPRTTVGLAVRYQSGVEFFAEPGVGDTGWTVQKGFPGLAQFEDGRKDAYDIVTVNGNDFIVQRGGTQVFKTGRRVQVKPAVIFLLNGTRYTLQAISGGLTAKDLLDVAASMK